MILWLLIDDGCQMMVVCVCWVGCLSVGVSCLKCTDGIMDTEFQGLWCWLLTSVFADLVAYKAVLYNTGIDKMWELC